jgi:hypothetical protein
VNDAVAAVVLVVVALWVTASVVAWALWKPRLPGPAEFLGPRGVPRCPACRRRLWWYSQPGGSFLWLCRRCRAAWPATPQEVLAYTRFIAKLIEQHRSAEGG